MNQTKIQEKITAISAVVLSVLFLTAATVTTVYADDSSSGSASGSGSSDSSSGNGNSNGGSSSSDNSGSDQSSGSSSDNGGGTTTETPQPQPQPQPITPEQIKNPQTIKIPGQDKCQTLDGFPCKPKPKGCNFIDGGMGGVPCKPHPNIFCVMHPALCHKTIVVHKTVNHTTIKNLLPTTQTLTLIQQQCIAGIVNLAVTSNADNRVDAAVAGIQGCLQ